MIYLIFIACLSIMNNLFLSPFSLLARLKTFYLKKIKNQIITFNKINNFGSYLAGLIEGDGSFYIPDNIRNNKGKLNQASIEIVFTKYDLSLANEIKHQIGGGYLI